MATFEQEWAQIKRETSADAGMSLASADGKSGWGQGGSGGLKSEKNAWTSAGDGVGQLAGNVKKALTALEKGQKGLSGGAGRGVLSAAAQQEVHQSWKHYLDEVSGRCGALQERLEKAGNHLYENDQAISKAFDELKDRYKDTPAVGGQSRGR
ncbi:hypothetical protein [Streptomyces olivoreticuli]|uniref:hypothetical protein n=1 Tax=Streptomyces olivoreticuli TaxID=68246 RepID=UPI000E2564AF|nr:hypothetical protein [Streptomyces olivoreticuli]